MELALPGKVMVSLAIKYCTDQNKVEQIKSKFYRQPPTHHV